jgi:hypothetical protein
MEGSILVGEYNRAVFIWTGAWSSATSARAAIRAKSERSVVVRLS